MISEKDSERDPDNTFTYSTGQGIAKDARHDEPQFRRKPAGHPGAGVAWGRGRHRGAERPALASVFGHSAGGFHGR